MTAADFLTAHPANVIVRIVGAGVPTGEEYAWIPPQTQLPFDLAAIVGAVGVDGRFAASPKALAAAHVVDWNGNAITSISLRVDAAAWERLNARALG